MCDGGTGRVRRTGSGTGSEDGFGGPVQWATGNPPLLIPCHHDDMTTPLTDTPALLAATTPTTAAKELAAASAPTSRVLSPHHLKAVDMTAALI